MSNKWVILVGMLFFAEMGDKSQLASIALAANYGVESIILGGGIVNY